MNHLIKNLISLCCSDFIQHSQTSYQISYKRIEKCFEEEEESEAVVGVGGEAVGEVEAAAGVEEEV